MSLRATYQGLPGPMIIGHRGLNTVATENSLEAIDAAVRQGAAGVEIDIRPCATGELMVMHDETLERTAGEPKAVADLSLAALRKRKLVGGEAIPTLDDVLDLCRDLDVLLNIELKRDVPDRRGATSSLAQRLKGEDLPNKLVVSSFDPMMLAGLRARAPAVPTALLYEPDHRYVAPLAHALGTDAVHPSRMLLSPIVVEEAHAAERRVMVWTVNDVEEAKHLLRLGVDGIITDDPGRLYREALVAEGSDV